MEKQTMLQYLLEHHQNLVAQFLRDVFDMEAVQGHADTIENLNIALSIRGPGGYFVSYDVEFMDNDTAYGGSLRIEYDEFKALLNQTRAFFTDGGQVRAGSVLVFTGQHNATSEIFSAHGMVESVYASDAAGIAIDLKMNRDFGEFAKHATYYPVTDHLAIGFLNQSVRLVYIHQSIHVTIVNREVTRVAGQPLAGPRKMNKLAADCINREHVWCVDGEYLYGPTAGELLEAVTRNLTDES
jgi:hypothetical protein